jgi:hypothetical protein
MSHIYSAVVKGTVADAEYAAKAYGGRVVGTHAEMNDQVTVFVEFLKSKTIYGWFDSSSTNAPPSYGGRQFPAGSLLYFRELDAEEIAEVAKHYSRRGHVPGVKFDLDGADETDDETVEISLGSRVRITAGGVDDRKTGRVVSPREVRTNGRGVPTNVRGAYKPVDWNEEVAVRLDDGELITMYVHMLQLLPDRQGVRFDLDGFESAKKSVGAYSVSTLVPALHGIPRYRYFETLVEALNYARQRARSGPRLRVGGKAYYVLGYSVDDPTGSVAYRVFRAMRGQEQRAGYTQPERKREFVVVQQAEGQLPNGKTHWVWDHAQSIEIEDPGALQNKEHTPSQYPQTARGWAKAFIDPKTRKRGR